MFAGRDPVNEDGKSTGLFIPRFRNLDKETKHPKFLRGYGFECGSGSALSGRGRAGSGFRVRVQTQVRH